MITNTLSTQTELQIEAEYRKELNIRLNSIIDDLSKKFNLPKSTIRSKVEGCSLYTTATIRLNNDFDRLLTMYESGHSLTEIQNITGYNRTSISKLFKRNNVDIINYQNQLRIREDLFESISTEEDAYWLGFILADGYISDKGNFEISLKSEDYNHLLKFADYCGFDKSKVLKKQNTNFKDSYRCRIIFAAQHLKNRFNALGIIPRKSLIVKFPKFIESHLIRHLIRGYIDGDGGINRYSKPPIKNRKKSFYNILYLDGGFDFLNDIKLHFNEVLDIDFNINVKNNHYKISLTGKKANKAILYLYGDSNIYLDRKYKIFTEKILPSISEKV